MPIHINTHTGKPTKFTIVTANAGAGALVVQVDGPSKVAQVHYWKFKKQTEF